MDGVEVAWGGVEIAWPAGLLALAALALYFWVWAQIFYKAGYSYFLIMAVGMFVPFLNVALALMLAFTEWPVRRELRAAHDRARAGMP